MLPLHARNSRGPNWSGLHGNLPFLQSKVPQPIALKTSFQLLWLELSLFPPTHKALVVPPK